MIVRTERMIAQHFDHMTIGNTTAGALRDHPLQLGLESYQPGDPRLDGHKLR